MKKFVKNNYLTFVGVGLGAVAGFLYWLQIGCDSANCAITSDPINSTIYWALMGGLILNMFKKDKKEAV
ncbi:hypothetical protein [Pedobacter flavus]|uniref:TMhelix containing protein n=1 Tax=Pedobacter flavus TaxID=3113906 RepID=A0ABU7H433_9SPHI|nr:hypothetical protein [Pedobacter sp. VNH31]MEE1886019.1 hypothetical protein [Pedobacter sp. VNH31]